MQLNLMQQAVQQALKQTGLPQAPPQQQTIWQSVQNDPARLLDYVQRRTGQTGEGLQREAMAYYTAMKGRYG